jgi:hypothetical protein
MRVQVGMMNSVVRAVDSSALLDARTMTAIVEAVLRALRDQELQQERLQAEVSVGK